MPDRVLCNSKIGKCVFPTVCITKYDYILWLYQIGICMHLRCNGSKIRECVYHIGICHKKKRICTYLIGTNNKLKEYIYVL